MTRGVTTGRGCSKGRSRRKLRSVFRYGVKGLMPRSTPATSMTIGRLAAAASVHVETVRYYQRLGLVPEPEGTYGTARRYEAADAARLRFIKRAQGPGFALDEIRLLLELEPASTARKPAPSRNGSWRSSSRSWPTSPRSEGSSATSSGPAARAGRGAAAPSSMASATRSSCQPGCESTSRAAWPVEHPLRRP